MRLQYSNFTSFHINSEGVAVVGQNEVKTYYNLNVSIWAALGLDEEYYSFARNNNNKIGLWASLAAAINLFC